MLGADRSFPGVRGKERLSGGDGDEKSVERREYELCAYKFIKLTI